MLYLHTYKQTICYFILVSFALFSCKNKVKKSLKNPKDKGEFGVTGSNTLPPTSPFWGTEKNLYNMSKAELQRVPASQLNREVQILKKRNAAEQQDLNDIRAFNLVMCQRLEQLKKECISELYIMDDHGLDGLNCKGNKFENDEPVANIRVEISGGGDQSYILIADSVYVSNEFTPASSDTPIIFKRKDNKVVKPPKFRDLKSLNIVSVKAGTSAIVDGRLNFSRGKMPPLATFSIKISVNGTHLLSNFRLIKADDPNDDWYYRINPSGILTLGQTTPCTVTLKELKELQKRSEG